MKIYRRKLLVVPMFWFCFSLYAIPLYLVLAEHRGNVLIFLCFFIFATSVFALMGLSWCYLIVTEEQLIIRNSFYFFWDKSYTYKEIKQILVSQTNRGGIYVQISTVDKKERYYSIECVKKGDVYEIVEGLKKSNIKIDIKGRAIEQYLDEGKKRKDKNEII